MELEWHGIGAITSTRVYTTHITSLGWPDYSSKKLMPGFFFAGCVYIITTHLGRDASHTAADS